VHWNSCYLIPGLFSLFSAVIRTPALKIYVVRPLCTHTHDSWMISHTQLIQHWLIQVDLLPKLRVQGDFEVLHLLLALIYFAL
jgi:hypothetical protein